jgi:hypothetical protein
MDLRSLNKDMLIKVIETIQVRKKKEYEEELRFYKTMNEKQMKITGCRIRKCSYSDCKAMFAVVGSEKILYQCNGSMYECHICSEVLCYLHWDTHPSPCLAYDF